MRRAGRLLAFCAVYAALSGLALAQNPSQTALLNAPSAEEIYDHFPPIPLTRGVSGHVSLSCAVAPDGSSECTIGGETPEGLGFGPAALELAQDWQFSQNSQPVASTARVVVEFQNERETRQVTQGVILVQRAHTVHDRVSATEISEDELSYRICRWNGRRGCSAARPRFQLSDDVYANYYPPAAHSENIGGRALVACAMRSDRRLDCAIEAEAPAGWGFGERALRVVNDVVIQAGHRVEIGAAFRVPVQFGEVDIWEEAPTVHHFRAVYPARALERSIQGRVVLFCEILQNRRPFCIVGEESPANEGFGEAARRVSAAFRLSEAALLQPGYGVGERIEIPISFLMH